MTIDLIRQARERLEQLQAESTQGEWRIEPYSVREGISAACESIEAGKETVLGQLGCTCCDYGLEGKPANAELIVTLHRTIDAQLEILDCGLDENADVMCVDHAELLAKAIMGVE